MSDAGKIIVDASVAVKWYIPESGSEEATSILDDSDRKLAPDLLAAEFGNVLWKKVRKGELAPAEARSIAEAFIAACPVSLLPSGPFLQAALDIAIRLGRSVYDSLYLAVALAEGCPLVTADFRFVDALKGTDLETIVQPLSARVS